MRTPCWLRYKTYVSVHVVGDKKMQTRIKSLSESAPQESSRAAHTWAPQPYKDVHKGASLGSPNLTLAYLILRHLPSSSVERSNVLLTSRRNPFARLLACTPACSPNSTFPSCHSITTFFFPHTCRQTYKKQCLSLCFEHHNTFENIEIGFHEKI